MDAQVVKGQGGLGFGEDEVTAGSSFGALLGMVLEMEDMYAGMGGASKRPGLDWPPGAGAAAEAQTYDLLPADAEEALESVQSEMLVEMSTTLY